MTQGLTNPEYHDNLDGHRYEGPKPEKVATEDVKAVAAKLLDDKKYLENLQKRLNAGEAGAIEIWLWRWRWGDPKKADAATEAADQKKWAATRRHLDALIKGRPDEAAALEAKVLGPVPIRRALPEPESDVDGELIETEPRDGADPLIEILEGRR